MPQLENKLILMDTQMLRLCKDAIYHTYTDDDVSNIALILLVQKCFRFDKINAVLCTASSNIV